MNEKVHFAISYMHICHKQLIGEHATIKHLDDLYRKKLINFYIVLQARGKNTVLRNEGHLFLISMIQERKYLISHLFTTNT